MIENQNNDLKRKMKAPEISESSKAILCTREKIEKTKKKILNVVESLLDDSVICSELIEACENLSQSDYLDVVEERNIIGFCGYPLCPKQIKIPSQKYHISCKLNKVYDITERKCFCSNICFKASKFVQLQLSEEPVWLQNDPVKVSLLSDNMNKGIAGEEVEFVVQRVSESDIHPVVAKDSFCNLQEVLQKELEECSSEIGKLTVSERNGLFLSQCKKDSDFTAPSTSAIKIRYDNDDYSESFKLQPDDNGSLNRGNDDLEEVFAFSTFEDDIQPSVAGNSKQKSSILIDPLPLKVEKPVADEKNGDLLEFVRNILEQWLTASSLKYLLGEKFDSLPLMIPDSDSQTSDSAKIERKTSLQIDYINLCKKLDKQEKEENEMDEKILKSSRLKKDVSHKLSEICVEDNLPLPIEPSAIIPVRKIPKKKKEKPQDEKPKKSVSFASCKKDGSQEKLNEASSETVQSDHEPIIPLVDSLSQGVLRQQIVSDRLKVVYKKILPSIGMYYKSISDVLRDFIVTLKLGANNITFRPNQWKLLALVFFRMLMKKSAVECNDSQFKKLLEKSTLSVNISLCEIDTIIDSLYGYHLNKPKDS